MGLRIDPVSCCIRSHPALCRFNILNRSWKRRFFGSPVFDARCRNSLLSQVGCKVCEALAVVHHPPTAAHHDHSGTALFELRGQVQIKQQGTISIFRQVRNDPDSRRRTILNKVLLRRFSLSFRDRRTKM